MQYLKNHWKFFIYQPDWSNFANPFGNCYDGSDTSVSCIVVCDEDTYGTYVGYIMYTDMEDDEMKINYIEVDPEKQDQGIGKNLVLKAIKDFKNKINPNLKKVSLTALNSAVGFYETLGFEKSDVKPSRLNDHHNVDMVLNI